MDGPGLSVVRTDRMNRLGHTALGPDGDRALIYRLLVGIVFALIILVVPIDIGGGTRLYLMGLAGVYVPAGGLVVHRWFDGDRADFANALSDITVAGLCCAVIPNSSSIAAIAITAIVVVAIPVHPRRLVAVLAVVGLAVGGALAYRQSQSSDWYLEPLVMAMLFPAFDLFLRDRRREWEASARRYEALIQASEVFFWEIDLETRRFVTAVGNCEGLLGYEPSELVGMRWTDFLAKEDIAEVANLDHRAGRISVTSAMICRDGVSRVFRHTVERDPGSPIVYGVSADISELAEATEVIRHQAERDHLTGLSNRRVLIRQLEKVVARTGDEVGGALFILDLNRFKEVNDAHGHPAGDRLLQELAYRLRTDLVEAAVVARLGGDEFAVLLDNKPDRAAVIAIAERMYRVFETAVVIDGFQLRVTASIGVALLPEHATTTKDAIRRADVAMYESKRSDRTFVIYHDGASRPAVQPVVVSSEVVADP